jgi:Zn finger protein HypA/HybF involved in hydrogenase expression
MAEYGRKFLRCEDCGKTSYPRTRFGKCPKCGSKKVETLTRVVAMR